MAEIQQKEIQNLKENAIVTAETAETTESTIETAVENTAENATEIKSKWSNKEVIAYLCEKFPLCFIAEGEAKPLKIGLFQDLAEALADDENVSKTQLRHALRQYTSNWRYLYGCRLGAERVDLQGNPAGVLTEEHVEHAQQQLAEAKAKIAEKRTAEKANAKENTKKRSPRKPQANKTNLKFAKKSNQPNANKPKVANISLDNLTLVVFDNLTAGSQVKVKVGDSAKPAVVLEIAKDTARVQLDNGLVMNVTADRLFA